MEEKENKKIFFLNLIISQVSRLSRSSGVITGHVHLVPPGPGRALHRDIAGLALLGWWGRSAPSVGMGVVLVCFSIVKSALN